MTEDDGETHGVDDIQRLLDESRTTLNQQSALIFDISNNAIEVVKINLLIGTLVFGALQITNPGRFDTITNPLVISGGVALVVSILISEFTYLSAEATIGFSQYGLDSLREEGTPNTTLSQWHGAWIDENERKIKRMSWLIATALGLATLGLLLIIGGGIAALG